MCNFKDHLIFDFPTQNPLKAILTIIKLYKHLYKGFLTSNQLSLQNLFILYFIHLQVITHTIMAPFIYSNTVLCMTYLAY